MNSRTIGRGTIRAAVELAGHAPSLHNKQPWRLHRDGPQVRLTVGCRQRCQRRRIHRRRASAGATAIPIGTSTQMRPAVTS